MAAIPSTPICISVATGSAHDDSMTASPMNVGVELANTPKHVLWAIRFLRFSHSTWSPPGSYKNHLWVGDNKMLAEFSATHPNCRRESPCAILLCKNLSFVGYTDLSRGKSLFPSKKLEGFWNWRDLQVTIGFTTRMISFWMIWGTPMT